MVIISCLLMAALSFIVLILYITSRYRSLKAFAAHILIPVLVLPRHCQHARAPDIAGDSTTLPCESLDISSK
jgi:hypothetical protein